MDKKRISLIKALITFGGSKESPREFQVGALPNTPLETGMGVRWNPKDNSQDDGQDDGTDEPDDGGVYALRRKKLGRSLMQKVK